MSEEAQAYEAILEAMPGFEHGELVGALEALIDKTSVLAVLEAISDVAYGKASHLRENWQDNASARNWERMAKKLPISDASYC